MSFADYKKRSSTSTLEETLKKATALNTSTTFEKDPDEWYPTTDKAGNAVIVVRALPAREDEEDEKFVRRWTHAFKNDLTAKWYINNCRSTLDPTFSGTYPDPVMEYNSKLWAIALKKTGGDKEKAKSTVEGKQASKQKRNTEYRGNFYIVSDSHKPEVNGKVKKWKYTQGLFSEFLNRMNPPQIENAEKEEGIDPWDLFNGANLKIKITTDSTKKTADGKPVRNYSYTWLTPGPLGDDKLMEAVYKEINGDKKWSLRQYIDPSQFKSYEELRKQLTNVMGYDPLLEGAAPTTRSQAATAPKASEAMQAPVNEDLPPWDAKTASEVADAPDGVDPEWFASIESKE
jgi:hypothetical protein